MQCYLQSNTKVGLPVLLTCKGFHFPGFEEKKKCKSVLWER